jgi:predicted ATP-grasp superfamily ATP-dependent carboligase
MNLYYTGLGIGRSLYPFGVEVSGLTSESDAPGVRSRFFKRIHHVPNSRDEPEALCERLLQIRREYSRSPVLFPTRDADVNFLSHFAERLAPHYMLPPGREALPQLMDKLNLATLAEQLGIPAPKTTLIESDLDVERVQRTLTFPVVVKPRSAHEWREKGVWEKVGARKAILVSTPAELATEYRTLSSVSPTVLVQEYISGDDSDIVVCCGYVDESGRFIAHFTGRKLRQSPPLFGTGCLVEASDVPDIIALSEKLLRGCSYIGLAEIEFKQDRATGQFMLIEVNPRHWDQHDLGRMVGVNLTWIAYEKAIGNQPERCMPVYKNAPRWIAEREAVLLIARSAVGQFRQSSDGWAISAFRALRKGTMELTNLVRGPKSFAILNGTDLMLSMRFLSQLFRELFVLAMTRRVTKVK